MNKILPVIIAAGYGSRLSDLELAYPKCFLKIKNKTLIEYHLNLLNYYNFKKAIIVVGYKKEIFKKKIGNKFKNIQIEYVNNDEYLSSGHGWSIYLTKKIVEKSKKDLLIIHADIFYDPNILKIAIENNNKNLIMVDRNFMRKTGDEVIVYGKDNKIDSIEKISENLTNVVGEVVGINKWSFSFVKTFFSFIKAYCLQNGKHYNWEPLLNIFLKQNNISIKYTFINQRNWININYKEDYFLAKNEIYKKIY